MIADRIPVRTEIREACQVAPEELLIDWARLQCRREAAAHRAFEYMSTAHHIYRVEAFQIICPLYRYGWSSMIRRSRRLTSSPFWPASCLGRCGSCPGSIRSRLTLKCTLWFGLTELIFQSPETPSRLAALRRNPWRLRARGRWESAALARTSTLHCRRRELRPHSHSIVPGGLLVMSRQTRLTPLTSLMMRLDSFSSRS